MAAEVLAVPRADAAAPTVATAFPSERVRSIDVLRGVTILLMIFVNDVAGVAGVPAWMKHIEPSSADGMTFVDVIFPAFLFIVGMSIPFALERRLERGASLAGTWGHILIRTFSLLVIGVFMVNSTDYVAGRGLLPESAWTLLMYLGVILVWARVPRDVRLPSSVRRLLLPVGLALLVMAALLFRGPAGDGVVELRPQWWGILGLIGWAYLVASAAFLAFRRRLTALLGVTVLLYLLYAADAAGAFAGLTWITSWVGIGSMLGSHAALTVSGLLLGVVLLPGSAIASPAARIRWAILFGAGMAAAAMLVHAGREVHQMFIINKIYATPAWCLWSAAITTWVWTAIYWWLDVRGNERGSQTIALSGQNALLAYILAPIIYAAIALTASSLGIPNLYTALGNAFATGFGRAVVLAIVICVVTAGLRRAGFVLKL